jgi:hypothetical protein
MKSTIGTILTARGVQNEEASTHTILQMIAIFPLRPYFVYDITLKVFLRFLFPDQR